MTENQTFNELRAPPSNSSSTCTRLAIDDASMTGSPIPESPNNLEAPSSVIDTNEDDRDLTSTPEIDPPLEQETTPNNNSSLKTSDTIISAISSNNQNEFIQSVTNDFPAKENIIQEESLCQNNLNGEAISAISKVVEAFNQENQNRRESSEDIQTVNLETTTVSPKASVSKTPVKSTKILKTPSNKRKKSQPKKVPVEETSEDILTIVYSAKTVSPDTTPPSEHSRKGHETLTKNQSSVAARTVVESQKTPVKSVEENLQDMFDSPEKSKDSESEHLKKDLATSSKKKSPILTRSVTTSQTTPIKSANEGVQDTFKSPEQTKICESGHLKKGLAVTPYKTPPTEHLRKDSATLLKSPIVTRSAVVSQKSPGKSTKENLTDTFKSPEKSKISESEQLDKGHTTSSGNQSSIVTSPVKSVEQNLENLFKSPENPVRKICSNNHRTPSPNLKKKLPISSQPTSFISENLNNVHATTKTNSNIEVTSNEMTDPHESVDENFESTPLRRSSRTRNVPSKLRPILPKTQDQQKPAETVVKPHKNVAKEILKKDTKKPPKKTVKNISDTKLKSPIATGDELRFYLQKRLLPALNNLEKAEKSAYRLGDDFVVPEEGVTVMTYLDIMTRLGVETVAPNEIVQAVEAGYGEATLSDLYQDQVVYMEEVVVDESNHQIVVQDQVLEHLIKDHGTPNEIPPFQYLNEDSVEAAILKSQRQGDDRYGFT